MGYEVTFSYHERLEEGGDYNKGETKQLKKKYGDSFEEVSLDKLASAIMKQLARRDVWVTGVEIFEYKKAKVNFRETKGGIVIKNRKFQLDQESNIVAGGELVDEQTGEPIQPHELIQSPAQSTAMVPHNQNGRKRPIKVVMVDDSAVIMGDDGSRIPAVVAIKRAGLQFQLNKRYPVFAEMDDPRDKRKDAKGNPALDRKKVYQMWDNLQREVMVSQDYFMPAEVRYEGGQSFNIQQQSEDGTIPKLMFEGELRDDIPDIRARQ